MVAMSIDPMVYSQAKIMYRGKISGMVNDFLESLTLKESHELKQSIEQLEDDNKKLSEQIIECSEQKSKNISMIEGLKARDRNMKKEKVKELRDTEKKVESFQNAGLFEDMVTKRGC